MVRLERVAKGEENARLHPRVRADVRGHLLVGNRLARERVLYPGPEADDPAVRHQHWVADVARDSEVVERRLGAVHGRRLHFREQERRTYEEAARAPVPRIVTIA